MPTFIERETKAHTIGPGNRLVIRRFADANAAHRFLNTGSNGNTWKISDRGLKAGTYAFAGGRWHNVRALDPSALAHF